MGRVSFLYRLARFFYLKKIPIIPALIRSFMRVVFSCDVPYQANIGRGTSFPHDALGVVIHPDVVIGEDCRVLHGVTIGGRSGHKTLPVIGNNVTIGANSVVLGPIRIGDNSIIGAGAVVTNDVPGNSTVVGVPAKVLDKTQHTNSD